MTDFNSQQVDQDIDTLYWVLVDYYETNLDSEPAAQASLEATWCRTVAFIRAALEQMEDGQ